MKGMVVGVDVGSTSARAGVFDEEGRMRGSAQAPFSVNRPEHNHAEHDSEEIWRAAATAVRGAMSSAGAVPAEVRGLAFDATCSLVMLDEPGQPVSVSTSGEDRWNVVMWADHRAVAEAREMTATRHRVLDYVGGVMSPEMGLPKLLWLKRHRPGSWRRSARAHDLADFLTWRATGIVTASACTVTCKWTYLNHESPGWQRDFLERVGLSDILEKLAIPECALQLGAQAGTLTEAAAADLELPQGIAVGVGLIDAHAGGLGVLAGASAQGLNGRLALIAGTPSCHMAVSPEPRPVPGVWGPYYGAMLPSLWLNEGGQSATGALLDHMLDWHAEGRSLGSDRHAIIAEHIERRLAEVGPSYASEMLVLPDFHGNRSPLADPDLRGVVYGMDLDTSFESLARLYYATAVGIAYGTRHIVDESNIRGYAIDQLHLTGGHAKADLLVKLYADATGCDVVLPREHDAVLLGSAINAAAACGLHSDLNTAGRHMVHEGRRIRPDPTATPVHKNGYRRFRTAIRHRAELYKPSGQVEPLTDL